MTAAECAVKPGPRVPIDPNGTCATHVCCECLSDSACDDDNVCTDDVCFNCTCANTTNFDTDTYCCNPDDGTLDVIDDENICTDDSCEWEDPVSGQPIYGAATHTPNPELCASCCYGLGTDAPGCVDVESEAVCGDPYPGPRWFRPGVSCAELCPDCEVGGGPDCNNNGLADFCDILQSISEDCNGNEIPDECDIASGFSQDCNGNGILDECDIAAGFSPDCNGNGVPDDCDIIAETSEDCTGNGIPDECEPDCQPVGTPGHGTADSCDILYGTSEDCNTNGIPDECELGACCMDVDLDGVYEACAVHTAEVCALADGIFRGACAECPEQNSEIILEGEGEIFVHVMGAPIDCMADAGGARGACPPCAPKIDPWRSDQDDVMYHNFGVLGSPAIPADFFGPGSEPFVGPVPLVGAPLGVTPYGDFGDADTLIARTDDPFDRCELLGPFPYTADPVDIEIVALSLASTGPITVDYDFTQELWDVTVDLSVVHTNDRNGMGTIPGMALIPGGEFEMGDHFSEGEPNELPVHAVRVDSFNVDIYEVTNQQYADVLNWALDQGGLISCMGTGTVCQYGSGVHYAHTAESIPEVGITWDGSTFGARPGREDHPIIRVTWHGAAAYANWRSMEDGRDPSYDFSTWECDFDANGYRLPTEAEWEYAARGGEHTPYYRYPWGDTIDGSDANYSGSGDPYEGGEEVLQSTPVGYYDGTQTPPGSDMANGYGLYDMAGNVEEWCQDWYASDYYSNSPCDNPHGPPGGTERVVRGGSWARGVGGLRSAMRLRFVPTGGFNSRLGFRLVLNHDPPPDPPMGSLTATRTHCNGGTYTSVLYVQPRCTFTLVGSPGVSRVLDTGLWGGYDSVMLNQQVPAPWVIDIDPNLGLTGDPCSDFHAGIDDPVKDTDCDCNQTGQRDVCEIEAETSLDCNLNSLPDECEIDESSPAPGGPFFCTVDCDPDGNANGIPDECDMGVPTPPSTAEHRARKNRYVSIDPNNDLVRVALQVELTSMKRCTGNPARACRNTTDCQDPPPSQGLCLEHSHTGSVIGWVQEPVQGCHPPYTCDLSDWFATIGREPSYQDWSGIDTLHIGDCEIVAVATYEVRAALEPDQPEDEPPVVFGDPLEIGTILKVNNLGKYYGDVSGGSSDGVVFDPPDGFVNVNDIQTYLQTMDPAPPIAHVTWLDLHGSPSGAGNPPQQIINVADLQQILLGDKGSTYSGTADPDHLDPCDCPDTQCLPR